MLEDVEVNTMTEEGTKPEEFDVHRTTSDTTVSYKLPGSISRKYGNYARKTWNTTTVDLAVHSIYLLVCRNLTCSFYPFMHF